MRILTLLVMLIACATDLAAQEQTLIKSEGEKGGFGGPVVKFTSVNGQAAILVGGRGGWIFDHSFLGGLCG